MIFRSLALTGLLVACNGDLEIAQDSPNNGRVTWYGDVEPLMSSSCVGCHAGDVPGGGLDLTGDIYSIIIDRPANQTEEDMQLIEPGDSLNSYLWHKINGSMNLATGGGNPMPPGQMYGDDVIDLVADWIDGGAKENGRPTDP